MKVRLLSTLLLAVTFAAFTSNTIAGQTVTVTTTVTETSCACSEAPTALMQALGFLLLIVLILAAVVAIYLIRLYRRTKF